MSQLSYSVNQSAAKIGQLADLGLAKDIVTGYNPASGEVALFGHFMTKGTGANDVKRPAAAADITDLKLARGVVIASEAIVSDPSVVDPQYPVKSAPSILKKGRIWVVAEDAITAGTSGVHVRYAGTGNKGAFRGAAVVGETGQLQDAQAKWLSSTTAPGQLALLEINL